MNRNTPLRRGRSANYQRWYSGDYPPMYKYVRSTVREKAIEIANSLFKEGLEESTAASMGLRQAKRLLQK